MVNGQAGPAAWLQGGAEAGKSTSPHGGDGSPGLIQPGLWAGMENQEYPGSRRMAPCTAQLEPAQKSPLIPVSELGPGHGRDPTLPMALETMGAPGLVPDAGLVQEAAAVPF